MERWNLPEDEYERKDRVSEIADEIIRQYDEAFYDYMNKILDQVREEAKSPDRTTQNSLGMTALETTKIAADPTQS